MLLKVDEPTNDDSTIVVRKTVGAPKKMPDGERVNVYLDAASKKKAARIGGSVSAGIRAALERYEERLGDGNVSA